MFDLGIKDEWKVCLRPTPPSSPFHLSYPFLFSLFSLRTLPYFFRGKVFQTFSFEVRDFGVPFDFFKKGLTRSLEKCFALFKGVLNSCLVRMGERKWQVKIYSQNQNVFIFTILCSRSFVFYWLLMVRRV